jgi:hypothetical protein
MDLRILQGFMRLGLPPNLFSGPVIDRFIETYPRVH